MSNNAPPIRKPKRKVHFDEADLRRKRARFVPPDVHDKLNALFQRAQKLQQVIETLESLAETKSTTVADIEREMFQVDAAIKRCQRASNAILFRSPPPTPPPTPSQSATPPGSPCAASPAGPRSFASAIPIEEFEL